MENKEDRISVELVNILETGFTYQYNSDSNSINIDLLEIGMELDTNFILENSIYNVDLNVSYKYIEDILLTLKVRFCFRIEPFNIVVDQNGNEIIPKDLLLNLINITIGTIRGILFIKMQNTPLCKYHLPIFSSLLIERMIDDKLN